MNTKQKLYSYCCCLSYLLPLHFTPAVSLFVTQIRGRTDRSTPPPHPPPFPDPVDTARGFQNVHTSAKQIGRFKAFFAVFMFNAPGGAQLLPEVVDDSVLLMERERSRVLQKVATEKIRGGQRKIQGTENSRTEQEVQQPPPPRQPQQQQQQPLKEFVPLNV